MSRRPRFALAIPLVLAAALPAPSPSSAGEPQPPATVDMAEMMKHAARYTQPGEPHRLLERFLGEWESETRITLPGEKTPAERGTSRAAWAMEGRWLRVENEGTLMQMPIRSLALLGYDNFKMSYVMTSVSSMDTAMNHAEGDVDPKTGALVLYGTIDEYLTGEHDKMVRYVWRFLDADTIRFEVHDLPIGETDTLVVEVVYRRKKTG